jgi:Microtubule-binding stalk of dynein motor
MTLEPKNLKPETLKKLETYTQNPNFTREKVSACSAAAAELCDWVLDMEY